MITFQIIIWAISWLFYGCPTEPINLGSKSILASAKLKLSFLRMILTDNSIFEILILLLNRVSGILFSRFQWESFEAHKNSVLK